MAIFMSYRSEVLADSPTSYYELNETSGNFVGTSGTVTGTAAGTITYAQPGVNGGNSIFVTGGGRFTLAYGDIFANAAWTIEMWAKTPSVTPNNYGTLWRRDGNGRAVFGRTADETLNNKIVHYHSGLKKISTNGYNDDTWHHIVWTVTAGTIKLYVDGVEQTTAAGTGTIGAVGTVNALVFGAGGPTDGSEAYKGYIAQVAIYDTVSLSPTRITAHYNAGILAQPVATPMTASGVAVMSIVNANITAPVMTANATTVDPAVTGNTGVTIYQASSAGYTMVGSLSNMGYRAEDGTGNLGAYNYSLKGKAGSEDRTFAKMNLSSIPSSATVTSATLKVYGDSTTSSSNQMHFESIDAPFDVQTVTGANAPAIGALTTAPQTQTLNSTTPGIFDLTSIVKAIKAGTAYGWVGFQDIGTVSGGGQTRRADLTVQYAIIPQGVNYAATPMTATAAEVNPIVTAAIGVTVTTVPSTATALAVQPTAATQKYNTYPAEVMLANAFMPEALTANRNVWATVATASAVMPMPIVVAGQSRSVSTVPATATALFVDGVFSNSLSISILVPAMTASSNLVPFKEAADPLRERYNSLINSQTDSDDTWFRFAETGATNIATDEIKKRAGGPKYVGGGTYYGEPQLGLVGAPGNRPYVSFDGINDYLATGTTSDTTYTGSIEMVFRTTKKNQALFDGYGDTGGTQNLFYGEAFELRDGKVSMRRENVGYFGQKDWTELGHGFKDVADGQWHHLVITNWWRRSDQNDYSEGHTNSIAFYIDGKLDKRIEAQNPGNQLAAIQSIGRPADASVGYFQGDISTFVNRKGWSIPQYWIEQNSYAALDYAVIRTGQMTAGADTPNARAKGNSTRVLQLLFTLRSNINNGTVYENGMLTETRYAMTDPNNSGGYRDPVTAERYYIDLMNREHIDIENYDIVELYDTPTVVETRGQFLVSTQRADNMINDFYTGLKRAVVEKGLNLWIKDPEQAKRLGFIDQYTSRRPNYEHKDGNEVATFKPFWGQMGAGLTNEYDYWAWKNDPFGQVPPAERTSFGSSGTNPYWYVDTHTDWGQRVVALEDGLTNLPGVTLAETVFMNYPDPFTKGGSEASERYDANLSGLRLGQEIIPAGYYPGGLNIPEPSMSNLQSSSTFNSVPDQYIRAGHVIAREIGNDWVEQGRPQNPYANNATVIIIKPGDLIDGVPTKGKVFMGFLGDNYRDSATVGIGIPGVNDNDEQKRWQSSTHRSGGSYLGIDIQNNVVVGSTSALPPSGTPTPAEGGYLGIPKKVGVIYVYQPGEQATQWVPNGSFGRRGFVWITKGTVVAQPGEMIFKAPIMTAAGTTPAPITGAQQNAVVKADPMLAGAELKDRANATLREAKVLAFPMLATARMTERSININAEPMLASAAMRTNFNDGFGMGKNIDLIFDRSRKTIVVYLRREN